MVLTAVRLPAHRAAGDCSYVGCHKPARYRVEEDGIPVSYLCATHLLTEHSIPETEAREVKRPGEGEETPAPSDVIVTNRTLGSYPNYLSLAEENRVRETVAELARKCGLTKREAAAVIAQSYGLRVHFS